MSGGGNKYEQKKLQQQGKVDRGEINKCKPEVRPTQCLMSWNQSKYFLVGMILEG